MVAAGAVVLIGMVLLAVALAVMQVALLVGVIHGVAWVVGITAPVKRGCFGKGCRAETITRCHTEPDPTRRTTRRRPARPPPASRAGIGNRRAAGSSPGGTGWTR